MEGDRRLRTEDLKGGAVFAWVRVRLRAEGTQEFQIHCDQPQPCGTSSIHTLNFDPWKSLSSHLN